MSRHGRKPLPCRAIITDWPGCIEMDLINVIKVSRTAQLIIDNFKIKCIIAKPDRLLRRSFSQMFITFNILLSHQHLNYKTHIIGGPDETKLLLKNLFKIPFT